MAGRPKRRARRARENRAQQRINPRASTYLCFRTERPSYPYGKIIVEPCHEPWSNFASFVKTDSLQIRGNLDVSRVPASGGTFSYFASWPQIPPFHWGAAVGLGVELYNTLELRPPPSDDFAPWGREHGTHGLPLQGPWQEEEGRDVIRALNEIIRVYVVLQDSGLKPDSGMMHMVLTYVEDPVWRYISKQALRVEGVRGSRQKVARGERIYWAI